MSPKEALKLIEEKKAPEYFWTIKVDYSRYLILPQDAAIKFFEAYTKGELMEKDYTKPSPIIRPVRSEEFEASIISKDELNEIRAAQLLNIPVSELRQAVNA